MTPTLLLLTGLAHAQEPLPAATPADATSQALTADDIAFSDAAVLIGLTGTGYVSVAGQEPLPLDRCATMPLGATICTGDDSFATLRLSPTPDEPGAEDVVLLPGTCVNIEEATVDRTLVAIQSGGVTVAAGKQGGGSLAVRTGDGTTEGSDGGFRVTLEDAATRTEAVTGAVVITGEGGSMDVGAGQGSRVRAGEAPEEPVDLLLAEALLTPDANAPLRRPDFTWEPVPFSAGYRVELSASPYFTDIVEAIDVPEARWEPDLLFVPTRIPGLWWRIAAYDRFGFLGVPSEGRPLRLPGGVGG